MQSFRYGNGINHSLSQTTRRLPSTVTDTGVINSTYGYDANGSPTSINDTLNGGYARSMSYDIEERLSTATGPWGGSTMSYDGQDNLTNDTASAAITIDSNNRAGSVTTVAGAKSLQWDSRGRLLSKGAGATAVTYNFDAADLLTGVTQGSTSSTYSYDALGYRTTTAANGIKTASVYDSAGRLMWEAATVDSVTDRIFISRFEPLAAATTTTKYVYLGSHLVAKERTNGSVVKTYYVHTDGLGSPVALTDANKAIVGTSIYRPYGELYTSTGIGNEVGPAFTNQYADATGLIYMHARYYDPTMHRFISPDPVGASDVAVGNFNRYAYAGNSPFRYFDPSGRETGEICDPMGNGCSSNSSSPQSDVATATSSAPDLANSAPIYGKAQVSSNTPTHASTSQRIAEEMAADPNTVSVHLNQKISTITGDPSHPGLQPDVGQRTQNGDLNLVEVRSNGQKSGDLSIKLANLRSITQLPGTDVVVDPDPIPSGVSVFRLLGPIGLGISALDMAIQHQHAIEADNITICGRSDCSL